MGVEFLLSMRETLAEMVGRHYGRNPALLMPKMESTSDIPGGPNLMCCCARLPNFRRRPGLDWKDIVVEIHHPSGPRRDSLLMCRAVPATWVMVAAGFGDPLARPAF